MCTDYLKLTFAHIKTPISVSAKRNSTSWHTNTDISHSLLHKTHRSPCFMQELLKKAKTHHFKSKIKFKRARHCLKVKWMEPEAESSNCAVIFMPLGGTCALSGPSQSLNRNMTIIILNLSRPHYLLLWWLTSLIWASHTSFIMTTRNTRWRVCVLVCLWERACERLFGAAFWKERGMRKKGWGERGDNAAVMPKEQLGVVAQGSRCWARLGWTVWTAALCEHTHKITGHVDSQIHTDWQEG